MKNFMLALVISIVTACGVAPAYASEGCSVVAGYAESVMKARQSGVSAQEIIDVLEGIQDETVRYVFFEIALDAYNTPLYNSERIKAQTVSEFTNAWYVACLEAFKETI